MLAEFLSSLPHRFNLNDFLMGFYRITSAKAENQFHFEQFVKGDETSLAYIYMKLYKKMRRYGLRIVQDDFVVNTIIQDAFLKVWGFRERMTGMDHVERFLKLTVRWESMHYYRNRLETLYRKALRINWMQTWEIPEPMVTDDIDTSENRLHQVRALIPKLPGERQRVIMTFYAKDGMSIQQIAKRLHSSPQAITAELRQSLAALRAIVEPVRRHAASNRQVVKTEIRPIPGMSNEAAHIVTLRRDMKYSFGQIADLLKLPQAYVQKQYVDASKTLMSKEVGWRKMVRA